MSTTCTVFLALVRACIVRPGRIVALGLLVSQIGGAAVPLLAFGEREVHACGCVGVCVCGRAEGDATVCPRSLSSDTPSLERCHDSETPSSVSRMIAGELFVLELPVLSSVFEDASLCLPASVDPETHPRPPRF